MKWSPSATSELISRLAVAVAALWWISLSLMGFLVVPLLFAHLPTPAMAGAMAAKLFGVQTWLSSSCGLLLLVISRSNQALAPVTIARAAIIFIVSAMLLAEFAIAPRILARENLRLWHSVGSAMYVLQWVCAATVFWKLTAKKPAV